MIADVPRTPMLERKVNLTLAQVIKSEKDGCRTLIPNRRVSVYPWHITHVFDESIGSKVYLTSGESLLVIEPSDMVDAKVNDVLQRMADAGEPWPIG